MKQIAGIVKTDTQNRKAIYKVLKMDKVPDGTNVLLAFLGHPRFVKMFKEDHPSSKITVLENKDLSWLFFNSPYDVKLVDPVNINLIKETLKDMKFDYIIMNPPYNGNLHLKILEEAMKHSDNVVNLSPVRWLQDPFADLSNSSTFHKFSSLKTSKPIEVVGYLSNIFENTDHATYKLGIYTFEKNKNIYDLSQELTKNIEVNQEKPLNESLSKSLKNKLKNFCKDIDCSLDGHIKIGEITSDSLYTLVLPRLLGNPKKKCEILVNKDSLRWGRIFYKGLSEGKPVSDYKKKLCNVTNYTSFDYLEFKTEKEAKNWIDSQYTCFYRLMILMNTCDSHRKCRYVPYMGNEINPRTGLKGYESEWTDEDFYKFFDLTDDEIKIIEDTMEKYK